MNWKSVLRNISILFLFCFVTACAKANETPTAAPAATDVNPSTQTPLVTEVPAVTEAPAGTEAPVTSGGGMPVAGEGQCANAYYPVREGATWSYTSTGSTSGNYSFTDTITSVRDDGFTLTSQFDNLTRTQEWACKPEGLVALQLGGGAVTAQNLDLQVDTQNTTGVSYPNEITVGDEWDYSLDFTGKMTVSGVSGEAQGTDKNHFTAIGVESVTVPAGTFDAMKILVDSSLDINVTVQGLSVPVAFTGSYNYWFVQGVGWVKAEGTGSMAGQSFSETIELQSYNIP